MAQDSNEARSPLEGANTDETYSIPEDILYEARQTIAQIRSFILGQSEDGNEFGFANEDQQRAFNDAMIIAEDAARAYIATMRKQPVQRDLRLAMIRKAYKKQQPFSTISNRNTFSPAEVALTSPLIYLNVLSSKHLFTEEQLHDADQIIVAPLSADLIDLVLAREVLKQRDPNAPLFTILPGATGRRIKYGFLGRVPSIINIDDAHIMVFIDMETIDLNTRKALQKAINQRKN